MTLTQKAEVFLAMHTPGAPVVVPTVWDPWSAEIAADAGFGALTIGSHPVATALGRGDGEDLSLEEMLAHVALITAAVDLPVSADLESGYGATAEQLIDGLLRAGAIGLNLEDTLHSEGGRVRSAAEHGDFIGSVRAAADRTDVHVVINARTDVLHRKYGPPEDRLDRAIATLQATSAAGADVLYPVGFHDEQTYRRLTSELPRPVNILARPDTSTYSDLAEIGVARISFGPFLQQSLAMYAGELLSSWRR